MVNLFKMKLVEADQRGRYVNFGKRYKAVITDDALYLNRDKFLFRNIMDIKREGSGILLEYIGSFNVRKQAYLTKNTLWEIRLDKNLDTFISELEQAMERYGISKENRGAEIEEAPADTCHECGCRGGASMEFGQVLSFIIWTFRDTKVKGVYCPEHAAKIGLEKLLLTGLCGWWGLYGLFATPVYIIKNSRALIRHSNLSKAAVWFFGVSSFGPLVAIVMHLNFIMQSVAR